MSSYALGTFALNALQVLCDHRGGRGGDIPKCSLLLIGGREVSGEGLNLLTQYLKSPLTTTNKYNINNYCNKKQNNNINKNNNNIDNSNNSKRSNSNKNKTTSKGLGCDLIVISLVNLLLSNILL